MPCRAKSFAINANHTILRSGVKPLTLTFAAHGSECLITLHHVDLPDDEMGRRHRDGWGYRLAAMTEAVVD